MDMYNMIDMSQLWPAHFQYYYMHCMYVLVIVIQGICALFWTCTFNEHGTWQRLGVEEGGWLKVTDNIHPSISPSIHPSVYLSIHPSSLSFAELHKVRGVMMFLIFQTRGLIGTPRG